MALVRCQDHRPQSSRYARAVKPAGFPDTALVCGREEDGHEEPGWVYLLPKEWEEYQDGKRVFGLWGPDSEETAAKVRVSDDVVQGLNKFSGESEDESSPSLQSQSSIEGYSDESE